MSRMALERFSTVDALTDSLRRRILDGDLAPRTQLREQELTRDYAVGRHTLRAGFQALAHEGLVHHEPHRGAFVVSMGVEDAVELYTIRLALEGEAARLIVENHSEVSAVAQAYRKLAELPDTASWSTIMRGDLAIHQAIVDASGNRRMSTIFSSLVVQLLLCLSQLNRKQNTLPQVVAQHDEIMQALRGRSPSQSVNAVRDHLSATLTEIVDTVANGAGPEQVGRRRGPE